MSRYSLTLRSDVNRPALFCSSRSRPDCGTPSSGSGSATCAVRQLEQQFGSVGSTPDAANGGCEHVHGHRHAQPSVMSLLEIQVHPDDAVCLERSRVGSKALHRETSSLVDGLV